MRVLVVHGSRHGATAGIADTITKTLREEGLAVEHSPASTVRDISPYDAVIVGGSLYASQWHHSARRFVRTHRKALADKAVWFFSSGPLDDSASEEELPPVKQVARLMAGLPVRGHKTFGGYLAEDRRGFIAKSLIREGHGGDFRDEEAITAWARGIATELAPVTG